MDLPANSAVRSRSSNTDLWRRGKTKRTGPNNHLLDWRRCRLPWGRLTPAHRTADSRHRVWLKDGGVDIVLVHCADVSAKGLGSWSPADCQSSWGLKACMLFFYNRLTFGLTQQVFVKVLGVAYFLTYLAIPDYLLRAPRRQKERHLGLLEALQVAKRKACSSSFEGLIRWSWPTHRTRQRLQAQSLSTPRMVT